MQALPASAEDEDDQAEADLFEVSQGEPFQSLISYDADVFQDAPVSARKRKKSKKSHILKSVQSSTKSNKTQKSEQKKKRKKNDFVFPSERWIETNTQPLQNFACAFAHCTVKDDVTKLTTGGKVRKHWHCLECPAQNSKDESAKWTHINKQMSQKHEKQHSNRAQRESKKRNKRHVQRLRRCSFSLIQTTFKFLTQAPLHTSDV